MIKYMKNLLGTHYLVSPTGEVYSIKYKKYLKPYLTKDGYKRYGLRINKKQSHILAHRIVAKVYLKEYSEDLTINHKDGNKLNNNVNNLEIMTHQQNMRHAYTNNLIKPRKGNLNGRAKLTEHQVNIIRNLSKTIKDKDIALEYNMSSCQINKIRRKAKGGWA